MASTSSSSHLIPTQPWIYDVFLSFRGEDTRKTFVGHLYSALVQQGIRTYKDDETLQRGNYIGPSLFKAILESQIAIIVLSENYADSSWCLDELAYIMEHAGETGQIVMPVFYDVDAADVRKQKGKYGDAFVKYELENNHKIESWMKALKDVGNISGWVPKDIANGHEVECIKRIVDGVRSIVYPSIPTVSKDLVGIETRLQGLKSKLEIGLGGVRIVGIWGVGGGGKTTLANSVYTEISHQFDARCFLQNVREETSKNGLKELQKKILSRVLNIKIESLVIESVEGGRAMMKRLLCNKKVLIVLDDVDDDDQLEALAGSHDWFGEGSRLIITTRDEHLLTRMADVIYGVSLLSHGEATELFRRNAYREDKPVENYDMLSQDVISYADGLPLALKILGSFLYDKDRNEWLSALAKLRDVPDKRIMDKLKISYDGLQLHEKELFLDIACFFSEDDVDFAMPFLDACGFHPVVGLKVLAQKSLITVSYGRFVMHDLIKEMAHYIVRGEHPNHPEDQTRVWQEEDVESICAMGTTKENYKIEALFVPEGYENPSLPQVVANMKNLRSLYWGTNFYHDNSIPPLPKEFQPTKLVCLKVEGIQKQLWKGYKYLPNLKVLDLRNSYKLTRTPDFNGLPCLERLILKGCSGLEEIHPSVGFHERLVILDMVGCSRLKRFPPIIRMRELKTLDLSRCHALVKFPEIKVCMDSLEELHLDETAIEIVPTSVGECCSKLEYLGLSWCTRLKRIEGNFHLLKSLKNLRLIYCSQLKNLPENLFDVECGLEVLSLCGSYETDSTLSRNCFMDCFGVSHQDSLSRRLPQFPRLLKKLDLHRCHLEDGDIPSDIFELLNLQVLNLESNNFSRLPSLSRLLSLKFLNLSCCYDLVEIPDLPSSIAVLEAFHCSSLEQVGDLSIYKCLWKVAFRGCGKFANYESVVGSLLQEIVAKNSFMSALLPRTMTSYENEEDGYTLQLPRAMTSYENEEDGGETKDTSYTLQLPQDWYSNFSGFLLCIGGGSVPECRITIKSEETCIVDSQPEDQKEFDKNLKLNEYDQIGYVPFASLMHTSWWNPTYNKLSFYFMTPYYSATHLRVVGLIPKSKGATDWSGALDEQIEGYKTFSVIKDSKFSIEIKWVAGDPV